MTAPRPLECGVVARWAEQRSTVRHSSCSGCGEDLDTHTDECPQCGQRAGRATAMLAQVIETAGGARQLVVLARTPTGGWEPIITKAATEETVRMIRGNAAGANARAEARATVRHGRSISTGQGVLA